MSKETSGQSKRYRKTIRINGRKIERTFSRSSDAERWYTEKRREKELIESGLTLPMTSVTVEEFSEKWLEQRKLSGQPLSSWEGDERRLRIHILPQFGKRSLQKISTPEWEEHLNFLVTSGRISPATRNRIRAVISKMYNDACRKQLANHNPVSLIPQLKESMSKWDYWHSKDEVSQYLAACKAEMPGFYMFAVMALNTGARMGEILALDHQDINLEQRRFCIRRVFEETSQTVCNRTKAHKERWLGLNQAVLDALLAHRENGFKPTAPLICDLTGKRLYERHIRRMHIRVCKEAGLKPIRVHDLRHTYASHYIMNGGSLAELQAILGHSTPTMTLKYAHLAPGFLESKASIVCFSQVSETNVISINSRRK